MVSTQAIIADPDWMPHRLDMAGGRILFLHLPRQRLSDVTFLAQCEPQGSEDQAWVLLSNLAGLQIAPGALHFVFHTAFCRSTLLARALDIPGVSVGYSEPGILNDIVAAGQGALPALAPALALLSRSRGDGELVFVKPSNHANALIPALMAAAPDARAVLLSNDIAAFVGSIHRKGLPGRSWARRLYLELQGYAPLDLGMDGRQVFAMSDLQVAALAWFLNRRWFAMQISGQAGGRMRSLDSDALATRPAETLRALIALAGRELPVGRVQAVTEGPVFARHAKSGEDFAAQTEAEKKLAQSPVVDEEIAKVSQWVSQIAAQAGVPMQQPSPLA